MTRHRMSLFHLFAFMLALQCLAWASPYCLHVMAQVSIIADLSQSYTKPLDARIYGVNFATTSLLAMGTPLNRNGGNAMSNWNWQIDSTNSGSDWYFLQEGQGNNNPNLPSGSTNDLQMDATFAASSTFYSTISTIGWVAASRNKQWSFSVATYGQQTSNECIGDGYQSYCAADAGNGILAGSLIELRNNTALYKRSYPSDAVAWIAHMRSRAGIAQFEANFIGALDNEPDIFSETHRDCHPLPLTYDELWSYTLNYTSVIKAAYPNVKLAGPIWCCWCAYFWSAADGCGIETSSHVNHDYDAHGQQYITPWLIAQLDAYKVQHGIQLLDYFDIHYYPNVPSDESSQANQKQFTDQVRSFYDPQYSDPGWIGSGPNACGRNCAGPYVNLLNLFQGWIASSGPHLVLPVAISEYSFDPEGDSLFSAALANAEVLSVFAKYNVSYAARWVSPSPGSVAEQAFKLYLSYDGQNSKVYGNVISISSSLAPNVNAYAVYNATQSRLHVLLFNMLFTAQTVSNLSIQSVHSSSGSSSSVTASAYGFNAANPMLASQTSGTFSYVSSNAQLQLTSYSLPARSATLLVLNGVSPSSSSSNLDPTASSSGSANSSTASALSLHPLSLWTLCVIALFFF